VYFEHKQTLSRGSAVARPTAPASAHACTGKVGRINSLCTVRRLLSYVKQEQMHVVAGGLGRASGLALELQD
jgi:hypothetical protein